MLSIRQGIARRILIAVGLVTYTLTFAEGFVRLFEPQLIMPRYVSSAPWGVRGNISNAKYWHHTPETNVEFRINSQGLRADREYPLTPPADVCRIAVFGDSFFMGYELDVRDAFTSQLETALLSHGIRAEVLNFSVSGFGTAEMLRTYEGYARRFNPDAVIFQWHSTDIDDNLRSNLYRLEAGRLIGAAKTYLPAAKAQDFLQQFWLYRMLGDHSHMYAFARERVGRLAKEVLADLRRNKHPVPLGTDVAAAGDIQTVATNGPEILSAAILNRSMEEVRADGRAFILVEIPDHVGPSSFRSSWSTLPPAQVGHISVVRPLDAFYALTAKGVRLYFDRGSAHLTPTATHALAALTAEKITKSNFVERCK